MAARFLPLFAGTALVASACATVVLSGPLLMLLALSPRQLDVVERDRSVLAHLVLHHPLAFSAFWWLFSAVALVASIGLLRRRKWALRTWLILLGLGLTWSFCVMVSETAYFLTAKRLEPDSFGILPSESTLPLLVAVPVALILLTLQLLLIKKLLAEGRALAPPQDLH